MKNIIIAAVIAVIAAGAALGGVAAQDGDEQPEANPLTPTNLNVRVAGAGTLFLTWATPPRDDAIHVFHWVEIRKDGWTHSNWARAQRPNMHTVIDLEENTTYHVRVAASLHTNEVAFSEWVTVTTQTDQQAARPWTWQPVPVFTLVPEEVANVVGRSIDGDAEMGIGCYVETGIRSVFIHWRGHSYLSLLATQEVHERLGYQPWRTNTYIVTLEGGHSVGRVGSPEEFVRELLAEPFLTLELNDGSDAVFPTDGLAEILLYAPSQRPCKWGEVLTRGDNEE